MATLAITALALYLLIGDPLLGRAAHRRMLAAARAGEPEARLRFYVAWTWQSWLLLAVTLAVTLGIADWSAQRLGLAFPAIPPWPASRFGAGPIAGFAAGVVIALVAGAVLGVMIQRRRRNPSTPERAPTPNAAVLAMLPRTARERRGFAALSVTAGITEEVVWRGFGLSLLFALLPDMPVGVPIALAAAAFGWAHFYQGLTGMLVTGILGGIFAVLFWATGSLLIPIVLHVLVDLRALLVRIPASPVMGEET